MSNPYSKYKQQSVNTASREKLLLMLYEAAIKFTKKAQKAMEEGDIAERGMNIGRAFDIIIELNTTLNHEVAPEIAANLEQLYMFITDQYTKANANNDKEALNNALSILETLYKGWQGAVEKLKKEGKAGTP